MRIESNRKVPQTNRLSLSVLDMIAIMSNSTGFAWRRSALPEVKIREIMIYESSSFLKRGNKLQSIRMRHFTTRFDSHGVASRANRLPA